MSLHMIFSYCLDRNLPAFQEIGNAGLKYFN